MDPSGGVVPGAKVSLTDEQKGFNFATLTDSEGRYVLRNLPPGTYTMAASAKGMRTYTQTGVTLTVGQNFEVPVRFELEGTTQSVAVIEATPLLNTQDASTGQIVNQRFINDLPLVSRNAYNLTMLSPGITQAANGSFGLNSGAVNFISNGGRNSEADVVIDGASQTNQENNSGITTALYTPPVDAVQEFNVQQNIYSADIGFGGNTVVNVVTKSGSNNFHGGLFEFLQNSALNSNNWFNNQNGVKISPKKQNQFGGTFGGPIRKDRTFFFMDYQGTNRAEPEHRARRGCERAGAHGRFWRAVQIRRRELRFGGTMLRRERAALGSVHQHIQQQRRRRCAQRVYSLQQSHHLHEPR
jgi:hypothetical protein